MERQLEIPLPELMKQWWEVRRKPAQVLGSPFDELRIRVSKNDVQSTDANLGSLNG